MTKEEVFAYYRAYHGDYKKITKLLEDVYLQHEQEIEALKQAQKLPTTKEMTLQKEKQSAVVKAKQTEIGRVISLFDVKRKSLQENFVRQEYRNMDGEYLLRQHIVETSRTPQMFIDAIQWLFSNDPKASFHRQHIMNIGSLIKNFNTIEHQAMYSQESVQYSEEAQVWANVYKKKGFSEEEILEKLREGGYLS